jgi:CRISPR-associated protein Cas2
LFVVAVYDVAQEKNSKVLKFLRARMHWVQNSVFEGELTEGEIREIKEYLEDVTDVGDSVIIYQMGSEKYVDKEIIGDEKGSSRQVL